MKTKKPSIAAAGFFSNIFQQGMGQGSTETVQTLNEDSVRRSGNTLTIIDTRIDLSATWMPSGLGDHCHTLHTSATTLHTSQLIVELCIS